MKEQVFCNTYIDNCFVRQSNSICTIYKDGSGEYIKSMGKKEYLYNNEGKKSYRINIKKI